MLPKRFTLLGHEWAIEWLEEPLEEDGVGLFGHTSQRTQTIRVDDTSGLSRRQEVLLHELLHAIDGTMLGGSIELSEAQINVLSEVLYVTLRDNPEVRRFIWGEDTDA
ncbi:MAG: hypothetical protein Q8R28_14165 [Dehalococcoidia bacterium]|nr:hypothetical protein [Dehalococcoidia bacterium]